MTTGAIIGVDWGTTSLRAYLMDGRGRILDRRNAQAGILQVGADGFGAAFEREVGPWLAKAPDLPVILSGMIGSRQGWVEVPYVPCPIDIRGLADRLHLLVSARGRQLRFVPGLVVEGVLPDVLRGEETELVGVHQDHGDARLFVLPGTHSKWATLEGGRIQTFRTFMTGELFAVLRTHSILGRLVRPGTPFDEPAFLRGAAVGLDRDAQKGGLLQRLFSARTLVLVGDLEPACVESYLSGLLIGTEITEALLQPGGDLARAPLVLVGATELIGRYDRVLRLAGAQPTRAAPDAGARGLFTLARQAGLLD